jgi:hypothetical protein
MHGHGFLVSHCQLAQQRHLPDDMAVMSMSAVSDESLPEETGDHCIIVADEPVGGYADAYLLLIGMGDIGEPRHIDPIAFNPFGFPCAATQHELNCRMVNLKRARVDVP